MNRLKHCLVWLSRANRCLGFGIQSPTDYSFVRYVINEQWPYYAYEQLTGDDWLKQKLGKLYMRLSNWRQPSAMLQDEYLPYWQAGCRSTAFSTSVERVELGRVDICDRKGWENLVALCDDQSVLVVESIWKDWNRWNEIIADARTSVTFDLYYCGIVFFDQNRYKQNYKINF